jgi:hypothetical protein
MLLHIHHYLPAQSGIFMPLSTFHAVPGIGNRTEPCMVDGLLTDAAYPIAALLHPCQGTLDLVEHALSVAPDGQISSLVESQGSIISLMSAVSNATFGIRSGFLEFPQQFLTLLFKL